MRTIRQMLSLLRHRGPDEAGYYVDEGVAMGTMRLSIIDLAAGQQPLSDASKRYWICFNGELYNYRELRAELEESGRIFQTRSDTEVVLQSWIHWKEKCLSRFNGAFAFAIYDTHEESLILARDRYGKRPLFYTEQDGAFLFSSEMKAFLGYESFQFEMDEDRLGSVFAIWTPLPDQTVFKGIHQLPMGEFLIVRGGERLQKRYAPADLSPSIFSGSETEAVESVRAALSKSIRLQLRSDVEVGVYISGGLDSAIVTQLASQESRHPLSSFSVEFEDGKYDESVEQNIVAKHFGTNHSSVRISHRDLVDNFPAALYHAEMPAFRTAFVPMYLLSGLVQRSGIKVVLTGEGADEAFLGYDIFKETLLRSEWTNLDNDKRRSRLERMYSWLDHFSNGQETHLMGLFQQFSTETMPGLYSHEMRFQNGRFATRLLKNRGDHFAAIRNCIAADPSYGALSLIQKAQWLEFKTLLSGYLLSTQGERMSLAHGVENRCPFLDPDVISIASSTNLRFNDGFDEKYLLKRAFEDRLPRDIIARAKNPYRAPDSAAFVDARPEYLDAVLSDTELDKVGCFDVKFCRALTKKIFSTPADQISTKENQAFIFLLSTALLHRTYVRREDGFGEMADDAAGIDDILVTSVTAEGAIQ